MTYRQKGGIFGGTFKYRQMTDHGQPARGKNALAWLDSNLAELLLHWPEPGPDVQTPFILMPLRGKVYLRMQYSPPSIATHATCRHRAHPRL